MANVLFKRGLQKNLPSTAVDGVFYLTQDTNRLYVGNGEALQLLNQNVQFIESIDALTSLSGGWNAEEKEAHRKDFYYITGSTTAAGNILATWNGTEWVQINPDIHTASVSINGAANAVSGASDLAISLIDNKDSAITATVGIYGKDGISVSTTAISASATGLVIAGDPYSLSAGLSANDSKFNVYLNNSSSTSVASFKVAGGLTLSTTAGEYILSSQDDNSHIVADSLNLAIPSAGTLAVSVIDSDENASTATLNNIGILLNDGHYVAIGSTSGATAGAIYSKDEIDGMIAGLDGMTFKGSIGEGQVLPTTNVAVGDVYVITKGGEGLNSTMFAGAQFTSATGAILNDSVTRVGDMVIAKGTETNGKITSNLEWVYVPAGNDSLDAVTYSSTIDTATHTINISPAVGNDLAEIALSAGNDIVLVSSTTGSRIATEISHATYSAVTPVAASSLSNKTASFTAIKGITLTNGHVTGIETDTFTPVTYELSGATASAATGSAVVSFGLDNSNDTTVSTASFGLLSDTIAFSSTANNVVMDIVWGSF